MRPLNPAALETLERYGALNEGQTLVVHCPTLKEATRHRAALYRVARRTGTTLEIRLNGTILRIEKPFQWTPNDIYYEVE